MENLILSAVEMQKEKEYYFKKCEEIDPDGIWVWGCHYLRDNIGSKL